MTEKGIGKTSPIVGRQVEGPDGAALGRVHDLVVDLDRGLIAYIILSRQQGDEEELLPVPWQAVRHDSDGLVLKCDPAVLDELPVTSADRDWSSLLHDPLATSIHQLCGARPYWETRALT